MCAVVFHQLLHEYCPLKHQLSLACRRNTYLWRHPKIVQRCQISAPRWPNDISSAADNAIFKNRPQNNEYSFGYVTRSAVFLEFKGVIVRSRLSTWIFLLGKQLNDVVGLSGCGWLTEFLLRSHSHRLLCWMNISTISRGVNSLKELFSDIFFFQRYFSELKIIFFWKLFLFAFRSTETWLSLKIFN